MVCMGLVHMEVLGNCNSVGAGLLQSAGRMIGSDLIIKMSVSLEGIDVNAISEEA